MSELLSNLFGLVSDTKSSIQFLSRLPIKWQTSQDEGLPKFEETSHSFPLAGLLIGVPAGVVLWLTASIGFSPTISALLAIACLVMLTGALHEDGLADVADGFWGGHTRERKLSIMRDSSIGPYGVLALILALGLRVALLTSVTFSLGGFWAGVFLCFLCALSRTAMLFVWFKLPSARPDSGTGLDDNEKQAAGLSARYGAPTLQSLQLAGILCLPLVLMMIYLVGLWPTLLCLVGGTAATAAIMTLANQHIGGHTGDVLGATQQISELGLLLGLVCLI